MPRERKAITVAPSLLEQYVGQYQFEYPETSYTITDEGGKLMLSEPGTPRIRCSRFVKDEAGTVTGLVARQNDSTLFEVMNGEKVPQGLKSRP